jgi:AcrR family transcriptional regulator
MTRSDPQQVLLDAIVAYVSVHGASDVSLRQLAQAVGTSHRMLLYHFGSKEALLVAVVEAVEEAQRRSAAEAMAGGTETVREVLRRLWRRVADPRLGPSERLFFELYGQALQGRPGTTALLEGVVRDWIDPGADILTREGASAADARALARLNLAVVRGLLLDLLATGDRDGVDRAMELFLTSSGPPVP